MLDRLRHLFSGRRKDSWVEMFEDIYREKHWGGGAEHDFYSGSGSYVPEVIEPYVSGVRGLLASFPTPPVVVDIGCGDFTAASRLTDLTSHYHGVDFVPDLIERNRRLFTAPSVSFHQLDAVNDLLPPADIVIVKQVLQHLSNALIAAILQRLAQYETWVVAEAVPAGDFRPNAEMETSGHTRLQLNSGVVLTAPPFSIQPRSEELLSEVPEGESLVRTMAYRF